MMGVIRDSGALRRILFLYQISLASSRRGVHAAMRSKFPDCSAQLEGVVVAQLRFQMLTSDRKFSGMHSMRIRARVASSIANSKRAANHDIGNAYHNAWFSRVSTRAPRTAPRESRSSYTYYVGSLLPVA